MDEQSEAAGPEDQAPRSAEREASTPVLISLRIEPGEPITGTLTAGGQTTGTSFCGWMELIAAITAARDGHNQ